MSYYGLSSSAQALYLEWSIAIIVYQLSYRWGLGFADEYVRVAMHIKVFKFRRMGILSKTRICRLSRSSRSLLFLNGKNNSIALYPFLCIRSCHMFLLLVLLVCIVIIIITADRQSIWRYLLYNVIMSGFVLHLTAFFSRLLARSHIVVYLVHTCSKRVSFLQVACSQPLPQKQLCAYMSYSMQL